MKYLKYFQSEPDREVFLSGEVDKPNVSVVEGSTVVVYTPNSLEFPVYLIDGDNGGTGIQLYNYLIEKYSSTSHTSIDENDVIYVISYYDENYTACTHIRIITADDEPIVGLYYGATMGDKLLYSNGMVEQDYTEPI